MRIPLRMGLQSLANLFKPPVTSKFPAEPRPYFARSRGHIEIDIGACIFCGACQRKCPTKAITVTRAEKDWTIHRLSCIACGGCVEVCPKKCLLMKNEASAAVRGSEKASASESFKGA
jgi:ech hydrogenase subunit F